MKVFCISIFNENYKLFKSLNLIPVGLGKKKYSKKWLIEKKKITYLLKMNFMENILFIITYGKII